MFCLKIRKHLIPYAEGGLERNGAVAIAKHLARCPKCAEELALIRSASSAFRSAKTPAMEPAPDLWSRIEREVAAPAPVARTWRVRGLQLGGAAAAAALILVAVVSIGRLGNIGIDSDKGRPGAVIAPPVGLRPSPIKSVPITTVVAPPSPATGRDRSREEAVQPRPSLPVPPSNSYTTVSQNKGTTAHVAVTPADGKDKGDSTLVKLPDAEPYLADRPETVGELVPGPAAGSNLAGPPTGPETSYRAGYDGSAEESAAAKERELNFASAAGAPGVAPGEGAADERLTGVAGAVGRPGAPAVASARVAGKPAVPDRSVTRMLGVTAAPRTSVDRLNDIDEDTRNSVLFSYP